LRYQHPFKTLTVASDAKTACIGAHLCEDGSIIIIGTGAVGYQYRRGKANKVSGWGFPHGDEGGGAWIGLQAVTSTFQSLDGRRPDSALAKAIHAHFNHSWDDLVSWANQANSTAYAALAPLVIEQAAQGDEESIVILKRAAHAIDDIFRALQTGAKGKSALPCALVGGIAPFVQPYLSASLQKHLRAPLATPDAGAVLLARDDFKRRLADV
jgi:glucosamine kinase